MQGEIDANETDIIALEVVATGIETVVQAATHAESDPGVDTLVERSTALGTQINNLYVQGRTTGYSPTGSWPPAGLTFTQGHCTTQLDMLQDARVKFQPYDSNEDAILTKIFSFGRTNFILPLIAYAAAIPSKV